MPTTVNKTVITTGGGDYTTLAAWEAARQRDLVAADEIEVVECSGSTADTTACDVSGWTTDATRYIVIQSSGSNKHSGVWDTSKYRLSAASGGWALLNRHNYTQIIGLQLSYSGATGRVLYYFTSTASLALNGRVYNNILRNTNTGSGGFIADFQRSNATSNVYFYNNLLIDDGQNSGITVSIGATFTGTVYAENNTIVRPTPNTTGSGINASNLCYARNNIIYGFGNTNTYTYTGSNLVGDNNSTDSTDTMAGTSYSNRVSQTFTFVDAAGLNFKLTAGDTGALGRGMQVSSLSSALTDDIVGTARPSANGFVCIGCFETAMQGSMLIRKRRKVI